MLVLPMMANRGGRTAVYLSATFNGSGVYQMGEDQARSWIVAGIQERTGICRASWRRRSSSAALESPGRANYFPPDCLMRSIALVIVTLAAS